MEPLSLETNRQDAKIAKSRREKQERQMQSSLPMGFLFLFSSFFLGVLGVLAVRFSIRQVISCGCG
jgi:hypothetical protein